MLLLSSALVLLLVACQTTAPQPRYQYANPDSAEGVQCIERASQALARCEADENQHSAACRANAERHAMPAYQAALLEWQQKKNEADACRQEVADQERELAEWHALKIQLESQGAQAWEIPPKPTMPGLGGPLPHLVCLGIDVISPEPTIEQFANYSACPAQQCRAHYDVIFQQCGGAIVCVENCPPGVLTLEEYEQRRI